MELDVTQLDFDSLTIAELEDIEEVCGVSIDEFFGGMEKQGTKKMKMLRVMAYIVTKRENPAFTFEEAGDIKIVFASEAAPDPKVLPSGNGNGSTRHKAKTRSST